MPLNNPKSGGPNHVAEYQLSSIPYALNGAVSAIDNGTNLTVNRTSDNQAQTIFVVEFPRVTRWIYIRAQGAAKIYFSSQTAADQTRGLSLAANETTPRLEMRVKKLYVHNADNAVVLNIMAGLTTVDAVEFEGHIEHFIDNNNKVG